MKAYINNNRESVLSKAIIAGIFVLTFIMAILFDDVTPSAMLFI